MDGPLDIKRYVKLRVDEELSEDIIKFWFRCLRKNLPSGIINTIQTTDNKGRLKNVALVTRKIGDEYEYITPLTRDIFDYEVDDANSEFSERFPDIKFEIEISSAGVENVRFPDIEIPKEHLLDLCTNWAKKEHEDWLKDRTKNGWSYGVSVDLKNKKHPLIRQWHELPDKFKKVDTNKPQELLDMFHKNGYIVVLRSEYKE
jgi:hypothetical protein